MAQQNISLVAYDERSRVLSIQMVNKTKIVVSGVSKAVYEQFIASTDMAGYYRKRLQCLAN